MKKGAKVKGFRISLRSIAALIVLITASGWLIVSLHHHRVANIDSTSNVEMRMANNVLPIKILNFTTLPMNSSKKNHLSTVTHHDAMDPSIARISRELNNSIALFLTRQHSNKRSTRQKRSSSSSLRTVTYASHHGNDDRFCRAIESAIRYHHSVVVLGWGQPWKGLAQKLVAALDFASYLPPTDLMLFTDAFDVAFTNTPSYIEESFLAHHYDILFSAECGCWPHLAIDPTICQHDYPQSPTAYRFLNSGTWIGYADKMKYLLRDVLVEIDNNFTKANDQKLLADFFLYRNDRYNISLDYHTRIFQSMHRSNSSSNFNCYPFGDMMLTKEKEWMNTRTNTIPAILHFNGGGKQYHLRMLERLWYKGPEYYHIRTYRHVTKGARKMPGADSDGGGKIEDQLIDLLGTTFKTMKFGDLCSDYLMKEKKIFSL